MENNSSKLVWTKPELVILLRSKPEESVLYFCKVAGQGLGPPNPDTGIYPNCQQGPYTANVHCEVLSKS